VRQRRDRAKLDHRVSGDDAATVVAGHDHDHIAGMSELFGRFGAAIAEFWEPGFFHTIPTYTKMMNAVAAHSHIVYTQPTSGMQRWFGQVGITVMSPSIQLRNRYDTYGVDINDSSISLRLEYPASRVVIKPNGQRNYAPNVNAARLVLGADAQTLSWSYVFADFPFLKASDSAIAQAVAGDALQDQIAAALSSRSASTSWSTIRAPASSG